MYPPVKNKRIFLLVKYLVTISLLLGFAWIDGEWLRHIIPEWLNVVLVLLVCLAFLFLYRLSRQWIFNADEGEVKVVVKYNMLAYVWIDVYIDGQVIFSVKNWKPKSIDIERVVKYKGKELLVKLHIVKSADGHNSPACSMSIDNVKLAPPNI